VDAQRGNFLKLPALNDRSAVAFWETMSLAGPALALVLMLLIGSLSGEFADFNPTKPVNFVSGFCILGTMLFPFAAFLYARGERFRAIAHVSRSWPTVRGFVKTSRIESRPTRLGEVYRLVLNYRYAVKDVHYHGETAEFGPAWIKDNELLETLAEKYPAGATVSVHYDPEAPETSALETSDEMARKRSWLVWFLVVVPFAFAALAAIVNSW